MPGRDGSLQRMGAAVRYDQDAQLKMVKDSF